MADRFSAGDEVRLTVSFAGFDPGSPGTVIGRYARDRETYVVKFDEDGVDDVPPDVLERVDES